MGAECLLDSHQAVVDSADTLVEEVVRTSSFLLVADVWVIRTSLITTRSCLQC